MVNITQIDEEIKEINSLCIKNSEDAADMAGYVQDMKAVLEGLMVCYNTTGGRSVQQKFVSMNFDEEAIEKAADIKGEGKISYTIEKRSFLSNDAGRDGNNGTQKP